MHRLFPHSKSSPQDTPSPTPEIVDQVKFKLNYLNNSTQIDVLGFFLWNISDD